MQSIAHVTSVVPLHGYVVRVAFSDGLERDLDLEPMLVGGILGDLREAEVFSRVVVDPTSGTLTWPNGVDLDPVVLHGDAAPADGSGPTVVAERRP